VTVRRVGGPPRPLRRARLDNLALVPANLLPYKKRWQALANRFPQDAIVIFLPGANQAQTETLLITAEQLRIKGKRVWVLPASSF
jgi:hypothetical protein